ncbi:hypothetical protein FHW69_002833 [Luteibacter sp. Sphag1AF]|uniref:hypothetical protein n=1 Tax=Luteibacter sp. Sphag1AF TaxID=2587031 RepID=UPI00161DE4D2|nr:hypothetical protein [Luteibacter sp. Sphag1AF]MBB3228198.1 hypothetical protein [Luteibacter sp. Sphag1AF]
MYAKVVLFAIAFACIGVTQAEENRVCASVPLLAVMLDDGSDQTLTLTVKNPGSKAVELEAFYLGENMLHLSAVEKTSGRVLKVLIPLLSPGVEPLRIPPKGEVARKVRLNVLFPELSETLKRTAVDISWKVTLKPIDGCFSQEVATTMTLQR